MFHAQINENQICIGISENVRKIDATNMIVIDSYNECLLGKKYNHDSGMFEDVQYPEPTIEPTPDELYRAANLLNQAEILANQRQQDKVMAAILLEQVGGEANV